MNMCTSTEFPAATGTAIHEAIEEAIEERFGNPLRRRPTLEEQLREAIVNKQNEIENLRQIADLLAADPDFAAKYEVLQDKLREL